MDLAEVNQSGVTRSSTASSESSSEVSVTHRTSSCLILNTSFNSFFSRALKRHRLESSRARAEHRKAWPRVSRRRSTETHSQAWCRRPKKAWPRVFKKVCRKRRRPACRRACKSRSCNLSAHQPRLNHRAQKSARRRSPAA